MTSITITVTTNMKSIDALDFGIYENKAEFTPPGTVTVKIGEDTVTPYTAVTGSPFVVDQNNIDLVDDFDFQNNKWYIIEITPTASTYFGRMRIEASVYIQVYIESK